MCRFRFVSGVFPDYLILMKRGMSSRRLASDSSGSRPSSERSASHNHRFQKSSISQDRQLESRKRARSESSGHSTSSHVRAASRDETGRKALETSSNFGQLTLGSAGEPSPICVIPEVEVFDGAPSKRRDRRLSNDGASTSRYEERRIIGLFWMSRSMLWLGFLHRMTQCNSL